MARRTFFSFDYKYVWKVNQIRSMRNVISTSAAGFEDASLWEEAIKKGDQEVYRMIDEALQDTVVTVVCVTQGTTDRKYLDYEIDQSLARGNGLVAVQIHHLKDQNGETGSAGNIPPKIQSNLFKAYKFINEEALAHWIEEAAKLAGK
jgi:hypothetical protein